MADVENMVGALMSVVSGIERAKRHGSANTLATLYILQARQRARPSEISLDLGVHASSVTRQIRGLEAAGHVEIVADPADGRSCFVSLTDSGRDEIARLTQIGLARFALFVDDWEAEDVRTFARLLSKFEHSKAEVGKRQMPHGGRRWQRKEDGK
ncbi:MAG TPA: MarR family transcriptional regulator [Armatimonadota bacterium]